MALGIEEEKVSTEDAARPARELAGIGVQEIWSFVRAHRSKLALLAVIGLIVVIAASGSDVFFTWQNFENILVQVSIVGILACGTTLLMVSGGIDLSIGSAVSLSGVAAGYLMTHGWSVLAAIGAAVLLAILVGVVIGTLVSFSTTHPFILTLGMLTLLQGLALLISNVPISELPNSYLEWVDGSVLGLPLLVVAFIVCALAVHLILNMTSFGRWLYAIGGSESAAQLAGIRVRIVKIALYGLNGLFVGIAAALMVGQLSSASPDMGSGLELSAIAAVAVGGTPLAGGRGGVLGTILGVLLLGLIANALNLLSITGNLQYVIQGMVIIVAVMAQRGSR